MSYQLFHFLRSKVFREVPFLRCYNHLSIYLVLISTTLPLFTCDSRKASQMLNTATPVLGDRPFSAAQPVSQDRWCLIIGITNKLMSI